MYSNARRLSIFCLALIAVNGVSTFLTVLFLQTLELPFSSFITLVMFAVSAFASILILAFTIRSILQDLEVEISGNNYTIKKLTDRIKELENKVN